jgi:cation-transporting ATPase F
MTTIVNDTDDTLLWYALSATEVVERLDSDDDAGLTSDEAARRLEQHGHNELTVTTGPGVLRRIASQFHQPLVYILLVAVVVTSALQEWVDAVVILAVVLVNAVIGYVEESRARAALDALARSMTQEALVIREGDEHRIEARELVPGDLVLIRSGDKVPADLRLVRSRSLRVDESALTGEAVPAGKGVEQVPEDAVLGDRSSMAFASTVVAFGQGTGVVVATGDRTELGLVSTMLAGVVELDTPLTRRINQFSRLLITAILSLAAMTFVVGLLRGMDRVDTFMAAVALTVAAIPEGLPAAMTIILAIGVARMARRRAIIRKLPAVETLGSTTVICSDKTGTLTANEMTVTSVLAGGTDHEVTGVGYDPTGEVHVAGEPVGQPSTALAEVLRCGVLCNDAHLIADDDEVRGAIDWRIEGDPTEGSMLVAAHKIGLHPDVELGALPRIDQIPFESEHQYMATLHGHDDAPGRTIYVKGSVERVLARCTDELGPDGTIRPLDADAVLRQVEQMASDGLRVLAFARIVRDEPIDEIDHADVDCGLTLLGLQGMIDPLRPEVIESVQTCRDAGISVRMITGDHPVTAVAIATQLGIAQDAGGAVTGAQLEDTDDDELAGVVRSTTVFARVSPEQKLRLVTALQRDGQVVAMTGDGVNDSPALKQADIGVAMGREGTDAAKDASDMILTDDNFASIRAAIEEGRGTYDNLIKFITWTLPTNLGEALAVLIAIVFAVDLPITPVQILWINMSTAIFLGLMLAFEPKEPGIMQRRPRDPADPILSRALLGRIAMVGALLVGAAYGLFALERASGASLEAARTVAVTTFVIVELAYLFNCRSLREPLSAIGAFTNRWVWIGSAAMITSQMAIIYLPAAQLLFDTEPIGLASWLRIAAAGVIVHLLVALEMAWRRSRANAAASEATATTTPTDHHTVRPHGRRPR